jgi:L-asparaginase/Glu-tRNA(Gln) amidotransferase subunit D
VDAFNLRIHSPLESLFKPPKKENFTYAWSPNVALMKLYPGFNPELLRVLPHIGCKGVIIEAFGLGNLPDSGPYSLEDAIRKLVRQKLIVGIVSQCLKGAVQVEYETAKKFENLKVIFLRDITSEAAYAKLSYLLGLGKTQSWIRKKLAVPIAGEMSFLDE